MAEKHAFLEHKKQGQILVLFALLLPVFMFLLMAMIDLGGATVTYSKAQTAVDSAAFAAAQEIDLSEFYTSNQVVLHQAKAAASAGAYASINSRGTVQITGVYTDFDRVWVLGRMEYTTVFGDIVGIPVITADITASAIPGYGIDYRGQ